MFDLATEKVGVNNVLSLHEHYRSHPDIIGFSNVVFYDGELTCRTDINALKMPFESSIGMRWLHQKSKAVPHPTGGAINRQEAYAIVAEIKRLRVDEEYDGTIGVVTPFKQQAKLIATLLPVDDVLSATAHQYQGDERDIIIFSPVVTFGMPTGALAFLKGSNNIFNVAVTRAKSQLIIVGDKSAVYHVPVLKKLLAHVNRLEATKPNT